MPREFKLTCSICGKEFTGAAHNVKYCSQKCKEIGDAARRRLWEQKTGYNEKRVRERREKKAQPQRKRVRETDPGLHPVESKEPLIRNLWSYEFWDEWKEGQIREAAAAGRKVGGFVNGIEISDSDFSLKVVISIQDLGAVRYEYVRGEPL